MPAQIKVSGVWKTFTAIQLRVSGVWKSIVKGQLKVAGVWKTFFESGGGGGGGGSPTVTAPANWSGNASGYASSGTVTTPSLSPAVSASGGSGSYTYSWARISAPDTYSGGFNRFGTSTAPIWSAIVNEFDPHIETWRVTATDSLGATGTADVVVELTWTNDF